MSKCLSCDKRPTFNLINNPALYCKDHKKPEMVNVTHKKCIHNKRKQLCNNCGGISLCEHNKVKYVCLQCKGQSVCEHNKVKSKCKSCGGSDYCIHDRHKSSCIECKGGSICIHNKRKSVCKDCHGSSICIHNKQKRYCKDCGGSSICSHNKIIHNCIDCGKLYIPIKCIHNIQKRNCKDCDGSSYCSHKKRKTDCRECGGSSLCKTLNCETRKIAKYDGHCAFCYYHLFPDKPNSRNYKTKERSVTEFIIDTFPEYTWISDKKVEDGCSLRRPDLLLDLGYQVIIIEIDETQHRNYEEICNNRRTMEISKDLDHRPIIFIRFNPDSYKDNDNKLINSCWIINKDGLCGLNKKYVKNWSERLNTLKSLIEYWCNDKNKSDKTIHVEYLFFDECSNEEIEENNQNTFYIV